jgi:hypothetical protein
VLVVLRELEIPFQFPGISIEPTSESPYRLSPARPSPRFDGDGLPVVQNVVFVAGSYVPVIHAGDPPIFHESPSHVSWPGSPGPGIV